MPCVLDKSFCIFTFSFGISVSINVMVTVILIVMIAFLRTYFRPKCILSIVFAYIILRGRFYYYQSCAGEGMGTVWLACLAKGVQLAMEGPRV